jgi:hypothetical protein
MTAYPLSFLLSLGLYLMASAHGWLRNKLRVINAFAHLRRPKTDIIPRIGWTPDMTIEIWT